jgi:hypothetical protein
MAAGAVRDIAIGAARVPNGKGGGVAERFRRPGNMPLREAPR